MKFVDPIDIPDKLGKTPTTLRTSIVYPASVIAALSALRCRPGTAQTTVNILLIKLTDELKRNGITSYDPEVYERAIADCTIVLGGSVVGTPAGTIGASPAETPVGNDRSRTLGVGRPPEGNANQPADVRVAPPGNSGKRTQVKRAKS